MEGQLQCLHLSLQRGSLRAIRGPSSHTLQPFIPKLVGIEHARREILVLIILHIFLFNEKSIQVYFKKISKILDSSSNFRKNLYYEYLRIFHYSLGLNWFLVIKNVICNLKS
jgi:hypothetical protein